MRKIRSTEGLHVAFSHAGTGGEALTTVNITIPIDGDKYIEGVNIIDCIKEKLLPNFSTDAISQELTQNDLALLFGWGQTGIFSIGTGTDINNYGLVYLLTTDNAVDGIVTFTPGNRKPTYT